MAMVKLYGFNYSTNDKYHYTYGHERADVVKDRDERFLDDYFAHELRAHRWVQISEDIAKDLEQTHEDFLRNVSYNYVMKDIKYCEYHVDTHSCLKKISTISTLSMVGA